MKRIIPIIVFLVFLTSCNQTKIAYVDIQEIMKEYKGTKETEEALKAKQEKLGAELDSLIIGWQTRAQSFDKEAAKLSPNVRGERQQMLMQEQQAIRQHQQDLQLQLQKEGEESVKAITKAIDSFVQGYAKTKGYNFVLGTSDDTKAVLFADKEADITEDVLLQLNKSYKGKE